MKDSGEVPERTEDRGKHHRRTELWSGGEISGFLLLTHFQDPDSLTYDVPWVSDGDQSSKSPSHLLMVPFIPRDNAQTSGRARPENVSRLRKLRPVPPVPSSQ